MNATISLLRSLALAAAAAVLPVCAAAADETVLHIFTNKNGDGAQPQAGMTSDTAGNLYGATPAGGTNNAGTVYELYRNMDGTYTYKVIYSFGGADNQAFPQGRVTVGLDGHLYITTVLDSIVGNGGVVELVPNGKSGWTLGRTVLFNGVGPNGHGNGAKPRAGLTVDSAGNLYGVAPIGGAGGYGGTGTVFQVDHSGPKLKIRALYRFKGERDGANPVTELLADKSGDLYGASEASGAFHAYGGIFQMHNEGGHWDFKIISESPAHGEAYPAPFVEDSAGNLYGIAGTGLPHYWNGQPYQEIFKLSPPTMGTKWTFSWTIMRQPLLNKDKTRYLGGLQGLAFDASGNAYVTIGWAGRPYRAGEVVKLTASQSRPWPRQVLYTFTGRGDGAYPAGPLLLNTDGRLYGFAGGGGNRHHLKGDGVLFSVSSN